MSGLTSTKDYPCLCGYGKEHNKGADIPEEEFRRAANVLPKVDLIGNNSLSAQVWAGYAINVTGLDAPAIEGASNSLIDTARARINLRVPPNQSAEHALALLIQHLESVTPWHAKVAISDSHASNGFVAKTDGPAYAAARQALRAYPNNPVRYFSVRQRIVNRFVLRECFSCVPFPYKG